jgi:hypothetical protein
MKVLYSRHMNKPIPGFEITEKDIDTALRFLIYEKKQKNANREDAIALLEQKYALSHLAAERIVKDEQNGKIDPVKLDKD